MPYLSIIVPVYNAENYIERCVTSIRSQSFTDWELILVNDGSTDQSEKKCKAFEKKINELRVTVKIMVGLLLHVIMV